MDSFRFTNHIDEDSAKEIAERINKDYPEQAEVRQSRLGFYVMITENYWDYCVQYVKDNCKIKPFRKTQIV